MYVHSTNPCVANRQDVAQEDQRSTIVTTDLIFLDYKSNLTVSFLAIWRLTISQFESRKLM